MLNELETLAKAMTPASPALVGVEIVDETPNQTELVAKTHSMLQNDASITPAQRRLLMIALGDGADAGFAKSIRADSGRLARVNEVLERLEKLRDVDDDAEVDAAINKLHAALEAGKASHPVTEDLENDLKRAREILERRVKFGKVDRARAANVAE